MVRAIAHPDNRNHGVAATRNHAARVSTGEALAFLDADDRLLPDHLERAATVLLEHKEVALVYGRARYLREVEREGLWASGEEGGWGPARGRVPDAFERLLAGNFIQMSTVVCRREPFFAVGGFDGNLKFMQEDFFLWTKLAYHHQVFYLDEVCAEYRIHADSYSVNLEWEKIASAKQFEDLNCVSNWVHRNGKDNNRIIRAAWQQLGERVLYRFYRALRRRDFAQARREARTLGHIPGKARLIGAPLKWRRARLESQRATDEPESIERLSKHYDADRQANS
jgi:glycosyltransferase involved in cell wall biosynthesis